MSIDSTYLNASLKAYRDLNNWDGEIKVLLSLVECALAAEDSSQVTAYLNNLDYLITEHTQGPQQDHLTQRLNDYRHRLSPGL